MSRTETGVDIVTKVIDETRQGAASTVESIQRMKGEVESSATGGMERAGSAAAAAFSRQFARGISVAMIVQAIDTSIKRGVEAVEDPELSGVGVGSRVGIGILRGITETLEKIPIVGDMGRGIAHGLAYLFTSDFERAAKKHIEMERERGPRIRAIRQKFLQQIEEDEMSAAERRQRRFEEEYSAYLAMLDAAERQRELAGEEGTVRQRVDEQRQRVRGQELEAEEERRREEIRRISEERDRQIEEERRRRESLEQDLERLKRRQTDDLLTDEERRRRDFEEDLQRLRERGLDAIQERLARELFEERELRLKMVEEERRRMDEQREADRRQAEERREAEQRARQIRDAEREQTTAQILRGSTGRVESFLASRGPTDAAQRTRVQQLSLLEQINENLRRLREEQPMILNG